MIVAAIFKALNYHFIFGLAKKIKPLVNMAYSLIGFITLGSILCNLNPHKVEASSITPKLMLILLGIAAVGFSGQYLIITANSLAKPSKTMPLGYLTVIVGFLADVYLF